MVEREKRALGQWDSVRFFGGSPSVQSSEYSQLTIIIRYTKQCLDGKR
jgi:hypothetical protein